MNNQDIFRRYIGKKVEIMLNPDVPVISGKVVECSEDFIAIGEAVLSYKMIWGVRIVDDEKSEEPPSISVVDESAWKGKIFEGDLIEFSKHKRFGMIYCPDLKDLGVELTKENLIFVHVNQISDEKLKESLLNQESKNLMIPVTFKIANNPKGFCADDVKEILQADTESELESESEIESEPEIQDEPEPEPEIEVDDSELSFAELLEKHSDWKKQTFEGNLVSFNHEKKFGFIESSDISAYIHDNKNEIDDNTENTSKIFVHLNQISDTDLKQKLMNEKNPTPMIKVIFSLNTNNKGIVADDVRAKFKIPDDLLKVQVASIV